MPASIHPGLSTAHGPHRTPIDVLESVTCSSGPTSPYSFAIELVRSGDPIKLLRTTFEYLLPNIYAYFSVMFFIAFKPQSQRRLEQFPARLLTHFPDREDYFFLFFSINWFRSSLIRSIPRAHLVVEHMLSIPTKCVTDVINHCRFWSLVSTGLTCSMVF